MKNEGSLRKTKERKLRDVNAFLDCFGNAEKALLKADFPDISVQQFIDNLSQKTVRDSIKTITNMTETGQVEAKSDVTKMPLRSFVEEILSIKRTLVRDIKRIDKKKPS